VSDLEIALWSGCLGIYALYACLSLFYAVFNRSIQGLQAFAFVVACASFVGCASGLLAYFFPSVDIATDPQALVLSASLATVVSAMGLRGFLRAELRDALIDRGILLLVVVGAAQMIWLLPFISSVAIEWVALSVTACTVVAFWLCLRAWLLGDTFALPMTMACLGMVFGVAGLFAVASHLIKSNMVMQLFCAAFVALYVAVACHTLKQRHAEVLQMRRALFMSRDRDLLTQLWTGAALIRKVDESIARARRNRKEMAVICIELTNTAALRQESGNNGVEQVIYTLAARVRHSSGSSASTVGRYSDDSFVVILDSVQRPSMLRTLGLRLAASARRPFMLNPLSTSPREFRADVGVGVARISPGRHATGRQARSSDTHMGAFDSFSLAQDVLHEAAELALAARAFGSRSAIVDAYSRKTIALESAELK
jgi:GGDEF domain-containing protein